MPNPWRQGDRIKPEDAVALGLATAEQTSTTSIIVISHSCDLTADENVEPEVEIIIGSVVPEAEATNQKGHSIRNLNLVAENHATKEFGLYRMADRKVVTKAVLLQFEPRTDLVHSKGQRALLRRWLAQRYARSEFPDAFIKWMETSGVEDRFEKLGKGHTKWLIGIYFDLDDDTERADPADPYALGISLVYPTSIDDGLEKAKEAKQKLETIFSNRCFIDNCWKWIELLYCDVYSDEEFTLRAANEFRQWRFEHRSVAGEPINRE